MLRVRDLLERNLDQTIEEIIKVDQRDQQTVYREISEYVVTDRISAEYRQLLTAMAEAPSDPTEGIGVWVSGFFGSGKSSFAKNLGYALANREVLGTPAAELFKRQFKDPHIGALIDSISARIPTEVAMFDVSVERAVRRANERLAEIMYTVLLRELGYAEDYTLADLEFELEGEGKLAEFAQRCRAMYEDRPWTQVRKGAQRLSRASAILHAMDPATYANEESWARTEHGDATGDTTVRRFVQRAFEMLARRRPGRALAFIIDEVGQYVARSAEKIEDLRAVIEEFGKEGANRVRSGSAPAPVWIVVTSQERLDEVVAAIDSKQVQLAKLQDRFRHRIDLHPSDIREVATRRVLSKTPEGVKTLQELFAGKEGQINSALHLERTSRASQVSRDDFIQFYPYPPHFIDLSIDIVSGIRLQPGAPKHLGGANRTIIKQAYEMLVNERTNLAERPVGALVTLDKIFELVEGNLGSERQKDIGDITARFPGHGASGSNEGWPVRVAKALCLLEFVRDLPRTAANLAAVLVDTVGQARPQADVEAALAVLTAAQFVRETEEGYKLQTAQEKNWESERRGHLDPSPRERNEIARQAFGEIFGAANVRTYHYAGLRTFRVGAQVNGARVSDEGQIGLAVLTADAPDELDAKVNEARQASRQQERRNELFWILAFTSELDGLMGECHASRQMIAKYDQLRAQSRITNQEAESLSSERALLDRLQRRLRDQLDAALLAGIGMFRGASHDGSALGGKTFAEAFKAFLDREARQLYPKLEMAARPLKGSEAEEVLKAANLSSLPPVFYSGEQGLHLIVPEGNKWVPDVNADVAKEVLDYLRGQQRYGNKVTGKLLETHFGGVGYGWDLDVVRLILAVLLRAGAVEVTWKGQRFRNHMDPQCRLPLVNPRDFREAGFAPRAAIDLRILTGAVTRYEELTGEEVDVDEAAIAVACKKLVDDELRLLIPLEANAHADRLPPDVLTDLEEYQGQLETLRNAASDDCVRILAGEGASLKDARDRVRQLRQALTPDGRETLRTARRAVDQMWPALRLASADASQAVDGAGLSDVVQHLHSLLTDRTFYQQLPAIQRDTRAVVVAYQHHYESLHAQRNGTYTRARDAVRNRPEWTDLAENVLTALLNRICRHSSPRPDDSADLSDRDAWTPVLAANADTCPECLATLGQLESDLAAVAGLQGQALARLQELTRPPEVERVERVRLSGFFTSALDSDRSVDEALARLREHLIRLISEGVEIVLE